MTTGMEHGENREHTLRAAIAPFEAEKQKVTSSQDGTGRQSECKDNEEHLWTQKLVEDLKNPKERHPKKPQSRK
jgi:hypothetical protein